MQANTNNLKQAALTMLADRRISLDDVAALVYQLQKPYHSHLSEAECLDAVEHVLERREVQFAILTGLALDIACEQQALPEPLQSAVASDHPLYGIDEVLGAAIANIYGTIGITNFGYADKTKMGLIGALNEDPFYVNTFADDLVAAIAAAGAARLAHHKTEA